MKNWSVKKIIVWTLIVAFLIGSILAGGPFNLIDIIIVRPIVNIQFMIFNLVHDFGLAIVIFAVLVKLCMWPLTKSQLKQTRLMRKIQPELTQIRKNCNGNKQLESLQTMDLYKRYNVKPWSSIVVLLIQLPIFIAVFSAIRVIATPMPQDNLSNRAYEIVAYEGSEIRKLEVEQQKYLSVKYDENLSQEERDAAEYNFYPSLFGVIDLTAKASDVISPARFSWSAVFMLVIAILASVAQYFATKMQMPSGKSEKSKSFRTLIKEAKEGKELDDSDVSNLTSSQMSKMMPIMMFVIMINLHGALAFYYFLTNIFTIIQQKIIYASARDDMDDNTDKAILRELKKAEGGKKIRGKIREAEIIENKKTGTKITRISASDNKKKRR
ncbi:YidC/Oxa1 family membrane protein insertase [Candidatus Saccharibacteria bacterium]|nr:YidC/Oxa1 family membrane protein insertase [Candidatus Saccharibacteria bacterium]MBQ6375614.1 YidC/Oxa1 family membrane protein insertase [Candidatus Saccharibacteria bacterium]